MRPSKSIFSLASGTSFPWWCFVLLIVLGQLIISFGKEMIGDGHHILGVFLALSGGSALVWFAKPIVDDYWNHPIPLLPWQSVMIPVVLVMLFFAVSLLNYKIIQIGYDADETLEFGLVGLPAYKYGWIWWGGYDETLTHNINAFLCRLFSIRFETFKLTAFFFRTAAGIFLWLLATELFGKKVGFWSGLIVVSSTMYMCSLDSVIKEISVPAVFLACLFFTFYGLRTANRYTLLLGGICAGVVPYTYISKVSMAVVLLCWPFFAFASREKTYSIKVAGRNFWWWIIGFLIFVSPFFYYLVRYPHAQVLAGHVVDQSSWHKGGPFLIIQTFWVTFLGIMHKGDSWMTRNYNAHPMLWWLWAIPFWIGLPMMLQRLRESRMAIPLLLMTTSLGLASLNYLYAPNFKLSRPTMLLSILPAAIGIDFLATTLVWHFRRRIFQWTPLIFFLCSFSYGWSELKTVAINPLSWWFRDNIKYREDFIRAHPQSRFFGVGTYITDTRPESPITEIITLRHLLETPHKGHDIIFLFPSGREAWERTLIDFWKTLYPGGESQTHTVSVEGGRWPVMNSYKLPASKYWFLPSIPETADPIQKASLWWQRAVLLQKHHLTLEAWRDALEAAHLVPSYYSKADLLLGNNKGREGRLAILIHGKLWNEACAELNFWAKKSFLLPLESAWLDFLNSHGLEMKVFATYTATADPPLAVFRQYFPEIHLGYAEAVIRRRLFFASRAEGQLYVPKEGFYRFERLRAVGNPQKIMLDQTPIFEFSNQHNDFIQSEPIFLKRGLHAFTAETCTPYCFEGEPPVLPCIPDSLSYLYNLNVCWSLKWQYEQDPFTLIPPQYLYAPGAKETPLPPPFKF